MFNVKKISSGDEQYTNFEIAWKDNELELFILELKKLNPAILMLYFYMGQYHNYFSDYDQELSSKVLSKKTIKKRLDTRSFLCAQIETPSEISIISSQWKNGDPKEEYLLIFTSKEKLKNLFQKIEHLSDYQFLGYELFNNQFYDGMLSYGDDPDDYYLSEISIRHSSPIVALF